MYTYYVFWYVIIQFNRLHCLRKLLRPIRFSWSMKTHLSIRLIRDSTI